MIIYHLRLWIYLAVYVNMIWLGMSYGLDLVQGKHYTCIAIKTSAREESLSVDGRPQLGTSKRAMEIFIHVKDLRRYLYWRGRVRNTSREAKGEVWLHQKGLDRAIVMGQQFEVKQRSPENCIWYTPDGNAFHQAVICRSTMGIIGDECGHIQVQVPELLHEGCYVLGVTGRFMAHLDAVLVMAYIGNKEYEANVRSYRDKTIGNSSTGKVNEFCETSRTVYNTLCVGSIPKWVGETEEGG